MNHGFSKKSKKQNSETIDKFNESSVGVLHSSKAADCGVDVNIKDIKINSKDVIWILLT